jgi:hypothetical protein
LPLPSACQSAACLPSSAALSSPEEKIRMHKDQKNAAKLLQQDLHVTDGIRKENLGVGIAL